MLARIEAAYLRILRVVILIAATLALVVAAFAMVSAAPFFLSQLGLSSGAEGGELSDFIEQQRPYNEQAVDDYGAGQDPSYSVSPSLQKSATRLAAYANKHHSAGVSWRDVAQSFASTQEEYPLEYHRAYEDSWERLTKQLEVSQGAPLTIERLDELGRWHDQNFQTAMAEREASKDQEMMAAITAFGTAGGAFLVFIFLVFCFLFVRIERNLRLVRVTNASTELDSDGM